MMNERDKILDRIRKMLNLANDAGAAEGERDNAMRMAHKLMAKHAIDTIDLEKAGTQEKEARVEKNFEFYGRPWARNVCHNIGRLFFCSYLYTPQFKSKIAVHSFVGRESNVVTAGEIAKFVVESIMKEAKRKQRESYQNNDWFRSFCWGAANSINRRVNEMVKAATSAPVERPSETEAEAAARQELTVATSRSMALVLANHYEVEARENRALIELKYPKLRMGRSGLATSSHDARVQGATYGNSVSLNRQLK